jgi:1-acyl-sn-glycerol-3-phosphate acyltransferase
MIEPAHWPGFARFFGWIGERKLKSTFAAGYARGLSQLQPDAEGRPTLVVANHSAWWDGMVAVWLHERILRSPGLALMDAENLRKHRFFQRCGALGVDLEDPRDGARFLRWAKATLPSDSRPLWIFPQGREQPGNPRPLRFEAGAASISRLLPQARVLPVALDYLFVGDERPSLFLSVGEPLEASGKSWERAQQQARAVEAELDRISALVEGGRLDAQRADEQGFERLFGKLANATPDLATRTLSALVAPSARQLPS